jgi:hypothetical protein
LQHLRGESGVGDITDMFAHVCFSLRVKFLFCAVFAAWMYYQIGEAS